MKNTKDGKNSASDSAQSDTLTSPDPRSIFAAFSPPSGSMVLRSGKKKKRRKSTEWPSTVKRRKIDDRAEETEGKDTKENYELDELVGKRILNEVEKMETDDDDEEEMGSEEEKDVAMKTSPRSYMPHDTDGNTMRTDTNGANSLSVSSNNVNDTSNRKTLKLGLAPVMIKNRSVEKNLSHQIENENTTSFPEVQPIHQQSEQPSLQTSVIQKRLTYSDFSGTAKSRGTFPPSTGVPPTNLSSPAPRVSTNIQINDVSKISTQENAHQSENSKGIVEISELKSSAQSDAVIAEKDLKDKNEISPKKSFITSVSALMTYFINFIMNVTNCINNVMNDELEKNVDGDENDENLQIAYLISPKPWHKIRFWILLFTGIQIFDYFLHNGSSDGFIDSTYGSLEVKGLDNIGDPSEIVSQSHYIEEPEPIIIEKKKVVEKEEIVWVENKSLEKMEHELLVQRNLIQKYITQKELLPKMFVKFNTAYNALNAQDETIWELQSRIIMKREQLNVWTQALSTYKATILELAEMGKSIQNSTTYIDMKESIKTLQLELEEVTTFPVHLEPFLVDMNQAIIPQEHCVAQVKEQVHIPLIVDEERVKENDLHEANINIRNDAFDLFKTLAYDPTINDIFMKDLKAKVDELILTLNDDILPIIDYSEIEINKIVGESSYSEDNNFLSSSDIIGIIDFLLEQEMADTTGNFDLASLSNGASIITDGSRRSSHSFTETLPILNRALSNSRLRFYGHGLEAALLPTFPKESKGQCWFIEPEGFRQYPRTFSSFVNELVVNAILENDKLKGLEAIDDSVRGSYATLTIRLASPAHITSVTIEHPPPSDSSGINTAIRNFHLVGFEDEFALGKPWFLGNYEFTTENGNPFQEFKLSDVDEYSSSIPKLNSLMLGIDSNWEGDVSCLYRFRVHGIQ